MGHTFQCAGIDFRLDGDTNAPLPEEYREFASPHSPVVEPFAHVRVENQVRSLEAEKDTDLLFDSGGLWKAFGDPENSICFDLYLPKPNGLVFRKARFCNGFAEGKIITYRYAKPKISQQIYDNPLAYPVGELMAIGALARTNGLLIHALGVKHKGKGILLSGHSGDGKSTLGCLWRPQNALLNDDRVAVRVEDGVSVMYGTPWHGDHPRVSSARLEIAAIFFLRHGRQNRLVEISPSKAAAFLYVRSFPAVWDRRAISRALEVCVELVQRVHCAVLEFVPTPDVMELVRCAV